MTTTDAGTAQAPAPKALRVNLSGVPAQYFAATTARVLDLGTSTLLVYLSEDGRPGTPSLAIAIVLAPVAFAHFVERAEELITRTPEMSDLPRPAPRAHEGQNWQMLGPPIGASMVVHARVNDLVGSDFYLLTPRAFALGIEAARKNPGADAPPVNADPVITCALDVWQFIALVAAARELARAKLEQLGAGVFLPKMEAR